MPDSRTMGPGESSYWRSLRELYDGTSVDEHKAREFMNGVTEDFDPAQLSTLSRKQFLALLAASAAFAAAGCTSYRDKGDIVPYTKKPEEITPGIANHYASTCTGCSQLCGTIVKTREGRPIKIDGNPDHPVNRGKICARGQASVLNVYDPARLRGPSFGPRSGKVGDVTWDEVDDTVGRHLEECAKASSEIALVMRGGASPSASAVLSDFARRFPTSHVYGYDLHAGLSRRRAWKRCYGSSSLPAIRWEAAEVILSLESDILGTEGRTVEQVRRFAMGRDVAMAKKLSRLYSVEGALSLTGANADYRVRLRPDTQPAFIMALIRDIASRTGFGPVNPAVERLGGGTSLDDFVSRHGLPAETIRLLVDDLAAHRGGAIIHAGDSLPEDAHVAVNYLNELLGNTSLYDWNDRDLPTEPLATQEELETLIDRMKQGKVGCVIHVDANPVHELPAVLGYAQGLRSVPLVVSLVETVDETADQSTLLLPITNQLESWGDFMGREGVVSLQQPVIAPLYDARQKEAVLLRWMSPQEPYVSSMYYEYMKRRWEREVYQYVSRRVDFPAFWHASLHDGVVDYRAETSRPAFDHSAIQTIAVAPDHNGYVLVLRDSHFVGDGRFANNGWLQELPHPVSKIVWDNYAALAPGTAKELGVETGDVVEIVLPHATGKVPVLVQPGLAERFATIELGYGRASGGPVGTGVGTNGYALLDRDAVAGARMYGEAKVVRTGATHALVSTQEHHALDDAFVKDLHIKRRIVREGTLRQYESDPTFLQKEKPELFSIATQVEYHGVKWAMAIDLNKCVGCNVCVSGCNVENNIPVVGKEQVGKGREMQWLRIDRYYAGEPDAPRVSHQPMLCQHCDQAPCENVCPVVATNHSPDGLNQMVYNRCVGTKYCSNNCPYKVRRFNFYNFRNHFADGYYEQEPLDLLHNPEVTVRSRGVMEKCTFCVQRIAEARQHAAEQGRAIRGSDVATACQQACPAEAIVFGDMNDPTSTVSRYRAHELGYHVLEDLNVRPNVTYIARLRNTHSEGPS